MKKNQKNINGVGVMLYSKSTNRLLYLLRNHRDPVWGIPGGKIEEHETLSKALERECGEEIGYWPTGHKLYPIERYTSPDGKFTYNTFFCIIDEEIVPVLNNEHIAYCWCDYNSSPRPLHGGLHNTLNNNTTKEKISTILKMK